MSGRELQNHLVIVHGWGLEWLTEPVDPALADAHAHDHADGWVHEHLPGQTPTDVRGAIDAYIRQYKGD